MCIFLIAVGVAQTYYSDIKINLLIGLFGVGCLAIYMYIDIFIDARLKLTKFNDEDAHNIDEFIELYPNEKYCKIEFEIGSTNNNLFLQRAKEDFQSCGYEPVIVENDRVVLAGKFEARETFMMREIVMIKQKCFDYNINYGVSLVWLDIDVV